MLNSKHLVRLVILFAVINFSILFARPSFSKEQTIVAPELGPFLLTEREGFYNDIFKQLSMKGNLTSSMTVKPTARAVEEFTKKHFDCLYGLGIQAIKESTAVANPESLRLIESAGFFKVTAHLFSKPGAPPINSLSDMKGKSLVALNGVPVEAILGKIGVQFFYVNFEILKVKMLAKGRVDAIIGWYPDIFAVFNAYGIEPTEYNRQLTLYGFDMTLVCHNTKHNAKFIEEVDKTLSLMLEENLLQPIFLKHNIPYWPDNLY